MLSKNATKYLRFLSKNTEFRSYMELERDYKRFDEQQFWSIYNAGFLDCHPYCKLPEDPELKREFLIGNVQFRINDAGKAYLEGAKLAKQSNFREWLALLLSVVAIIISIVTSVS